ncbi:hypothetical protein [Kribbella sp. NPDC051137]|uniref:hypothetical protein n=1 Tax=Kribbella sp. NPDC051137 TaxID=3155045 RepID=UPI0034286AC9
MATRGVGKVARARIVPPAQPSLLTDPGEAVATALSSGLAVERYQRTWRVGGLQRISGALVGRLGFESTHAEDLWDPEIQDFEEVEVPGGVAAPFAVGVDDLLVVFQIRSPFIRINSFVGALRTLLRESTEQDGWTVEAVQQSQTFAEWRRSVTRVTRLRVRVLRPNPNYEGRPSVENLIESARLSSANLDLRSEDIDTDAEIVRELLDHVDRGYGDGTVVGQRETVGGEVETVYTTGMSGSTDLAELPVDPESGEVDRQTLAEELSQLSEELTNPGE